MSMRNREGGSILDRPGFDPADDPGSLCLPFRKKHEPICHCRVPEKGRLGGMTPKMDLSTMQCRCAVCLKVIGPSCKRREVTHLKGLLKLLQTHPGMVDLDDCREAGFIFERPAAG